MMKQLLIISLMAIVAVYSRAQGASEEEALWIIDGLVMDTTTVVQGEVPDSIEPWLERYFPLIKIDDIEEIRLLRAIDAMPSACNGLVKLILITTKKDSGIRDLELNGAYTTKRKRIGLAELSCKTYLDRTIEKKWKIKSIQSVQIHPEGKTIVDRKGRHHTVYITITTN